MSKERAGVGGLGDRVRELRQARHWSQGEVPGFAQGQVSQWETGKFLPRAADVVRLAGLFGVTTDYLLRGEEAAVGPVHRDPRGTLLLSRSSDDEGGVREVTPFRLDHEGSLWGHRVDAFWVVDARAEGGVGGLRTGDALLLERAPPAAVREDPAGPLYVVAQPGRRPRLRRVLRLMAPEEDGGEVARLVCDGSIEAVAVGDALYRVVGVMRPAVALDEAPRGSGARAVDPQRAEQDQILHLAAAAGMPAPMIDAAVRASMDAIFGDGDGEDWPGRAAQMAKVRALAEEAMRAQISGQGPKEIAGKFSAMLDAVEELTPSGGNGHPTAFSSGTIEDLANSSAGTVALLDGGSTDPRLLRAVRAMARRMGPVVRQSEGNSPTDLVTMAEAARLIGVTRQAVHLAVTSGRLPTYGDGRVGRVSLREARMLVGGDAADPAASRRGRGASPGGKTGPEDAVSPASEAHRQVAGPDDQETRPDPAQGQGRGGPGAAPEDAAARDAEPEPRRVLLADLVANPPQPLEPHIAGQMHEWVRWADGRYDEETMLRYEQDPPEDLPPPWDYHHYDYWEVRRSAAHGLQWWEYPEEHKLAEYVRFIRRMEEMYREGDRTMRSALWLTARTEYGPDAPLPDDGYEP